MAKGDKVKVVLDYGSGNVGIVELSADLAGRTIEVERNKSAGTIDVVVQTRGGTEVRKASFRTDRVISIEEIPA